MNAMASRQNGAAELKVLVRCSALITSMLGRRPEGKGAERRLRMREESAQDTLLQELETVLTAQEIRRARGRGPLSPL